MNEINYYNVSVELAVAAINDDYSGLEYFEENALFAFLETLEERHGCGNFALGRHLEPDTGFSDTCAVTNKLALTIELAYVSNWSK